MAGPDERSRVREKEPAFCVGVGPQAPARIKYLCRGLALLDVAGPGICRMPRPRRRSSRR